MRTCSLLDPPPLRLLLRRRSRTQSLAVPALSSFHEISWRQRFGWRLPGIVERAPPPRVLEDELLLGR
jgi:hypothetical protein